MSICSIDKDLKEKLKKFRFRKATNNAAIISKKICRCFHFVLTSVSCNYVVIYCLRMQTIVYS